MTSRKGTIPYEGRITADCHIHTEFSSDSETKITDQVERAIALGPVSYTHLDVYKRQAYINPVWMRWILGRLC